MTKRITVEECEALFEAYETPQRVIGHCREVSRVAYTIGKELKAKGYAMDLDLIRGAGLIHDVMRVKDKHWELGAEILEELGYQAEADIVRVHMTYDFHLFEELDETDMVCLADRLVKENHYVGLDERIEYILAKASGNSIVQKRILMKKEETRQLMEQIESLIGQTIDSLFL